MRKKTHICCVKAADEKSKDITERLVSLEEKLSKDIR